MGTFRPRLLCKDDAEMFLQFATGQHIHKSQFIDVMTPLQIPVYRGNDTSTNPDLSQILIF